MKSINFSLLFIASLTTLVVGCQESSLMKDLPLAEDHITTRAAKITNDYFVSEQEAKYYVNLLYSEQEVSSIEPVVIEKDTLIYLINFEKGWIAIAADKRVPPVIGQDDDSELHLKRKENGVIVWLNTCATDILSMQRYGNEGNNSNTDLWDFIESKKYSSIKDLRTKGPDDRWAVFLIGTHTDYFTDQVNHLVTTKWGQDSPWNQKLPYDVNIGHTCVTGCVPVAMSQLIYYYKNKFSLNLGLYHTVGCSYNTVYGPTTNIGFYHSDYHSNSSRWSLMALTDSDISSHSTEYPGDLMLELGKELNASYSGSNTDVNSSYSPYNVFHDYSIDCVSSSYSYAIVKNNLDAGLPVMVSSYTSPTAESGHCWIIDGYVESTEQLTNTYLLIYTDQYEGAIATYTDSQVEEVFGEYYSDGMEWDEYFVYDTVKRLYMNWGYGGQYDSGTYTISPGTNWRNYSYNTLIYHDFNSL